MSSTPANGACPVVGIGASAGGLDALQRFLPHFEPGCGLALVAVVHLDPERKSMLPEILKRSAKLPVHSIEERMKVEPDHIYVIPPNATATMKDCVLHLAKPESPRGQRTPIDSFLISLAEDQGGKAACVILSGTGSDGTLGLRAIKEHGGFTLAQAGAEHQGMMQSALATGLVDFVLPAEEMAARLGDYFRHGAVLAKEGGADGAMWDPAHHLAQINTLLRARTGHDFGGYKDSTVVRRIQRRMQVLQVADVADFVARLRQDPQQIDLLFQDMLIGVTNFFRDPQVWQQIERQVIPKLFEAKGAEDSIRIWVPGCSTGEEAYSLAILLREHAPRGAGMPKLQIFASDIDEPSLEFARIGRYSTAIAGDVSADRLERFFVREDGTYRVVSDLREICLFSAHNLLRDAPFSKLDLVSCRNLLIYLESEMQKRVIPLFHYALKEGGFLVLGTSENVSHHARMFAPVDKAHRIFIRRQLPVRELPDFPLMPDGHRGRTGPSSRMERPDASLATAVEREVLEHFAPAHVIIDADGEVLHVSARTGKYLELPPGAPNRNVYSMARRGLRADLRAAVRRVIDTGQPFTQHNVTLGINGGRQTVDLIVQPILQRSAADSLYMVVFQDMGSVTPASEGDKLADVESINLRQLEAELLATKERLQTTTEELESSNEELKSSNEELSSMNEELQSANEELETSKEELQSINEELQTVNAELNARVDELSRANSDVANLLESTQIATLFVDGNYCIKSFTPAAKDLFHLVESDVGRPILHVRQRFDYATLKDDADRVLRTLVPVEKEVVSTDGTARYTMRILPYRTLDNVIGGLVLTFVDITRISAAELRIDELTVDLRNRIENLGVVLDIVPAGIFIVEDADAKAVRVNRAGAELLGMQGVRSGWQPLAKQIHLADGERDIPFGEHPLVRAALTGKSVAGYEARLLRPDGTAIDILIAAAPLTTGGGERRGAIAAMTEITQIKSSEAQRETLLHELQHRVKNTLATVSSLAARMIKSSGSLEEFSDAFLGRLMAMGAMHELLSSRNWEGADLKALLLVGVAPYILRDREAFTANGPDVLLTANAAATLGMVFHELATNAAKYGALSQPSGRLDVSWRVEQTRNQARLSLSWAERGGPKVNPPSREGFGTIFVQRSVEYEMDGRAAFEFEPSGVTCTLVFPFRHNVLTVDSRDAAGE